MRLIEIWDERLTVSDDKFTRHRIDQYRQYAREEEICERESQGQRGDMREDCSTHPIQWEPDFLLPTGATLGCSSSSILNLCLRGN